jgi:K+/H+ antiporter YhaU regulatory subunit KhtT
MVNKLKNTIVKRKKNRYRMVIMNDDTFEEVVTFKLTRTSVYVMLSTLFLLLTGLTIAVISFTDLRFLIPGYGKQGALQELRTLKMKTDSMEHVMQLNEQYFMDLHKVLSGNQLEEKLDTTMLKLPKIENEYQ